MNKTTIEKYKLFTRMLDRWSTLPRNIVIDLVDNHEINEQLLNRVRAENLKQYIKQQKNDQRL